MEQQCQFDVDFLGGIANSLELRGGYFNAFTRSLFLALMLHVIGPCCRGMVDSKTPMNYNT